MLDFRRTLRPVQAHRLAGGIAITATIALAGGAAISQAPAANVQSFRNDAGILRTFSTQGFIDRTNPFFHPLGQKFATTCEHCHFASDGWGISKAHINQLFNSSNGLHPLFSAPSANDFLAAGIPANVATVDQRRALFSEMLNKGDALVRRNLNATPDFTLLGVETDKIQGLPTISYFDPTDSTTHTLINGPDYLNYTASSNAGQPQIWVYRRPLPTTNFRFLTTVAWDGQDTRQSPNPIVRPTRAGVFDVVEATIKGRQTGPSLIAPDGHTYTKPEEDAIANQITDFMGSTFVAQDYDLGAGALNANGAQGGVYNLATIPFYPGINDLIQGNFFFAPDGHQVFTGPAFTPVIFTQYNDWAGSSNTHRASIARGEALFNSQRLTVDHVAGINNSAITLPDGSVIQGPNGPIVGSCGTCHDSPGVGNHSTRLPINIGISDPAPAFLGRDRVADLPLFFIKRNSDGLVVKTTDPGRAVISGKFAHIGEFKGPILHALAARAPYFHNGMADTLDEVVNFYNVRFNAHFTDQEKADLVAFLKTL